MTQKERAVVDAKWAEFMTGFPGIDTYPLFLKEEGIVLTRPELNNLIEEVLLAASADTDAREKSENYAISLQRIIEFHCRGEIIPTELLQKSPHLAGKLNQHRADIEAREREAVEFGVLWGMRQVGNVYPSLAEEIKTAYAAYLKSKEKEG